MQSVQELLPRIDAQTHRFHTNFGQLNPAELNTKPNADAWSLGQIVKHLIQINQSYYPIFDGLLAGTYSAPFHSRFGWLVNRFGQMIYKSVLPTTAKKGKTLPIWDPGQSDVDGNILAQFAEEQNWLKKYLEQLDTMAQKGTVIHSPASRAIVYPLATAFNIIVAHEERHLEQALGVLKLISH
jgi:hypothetical protein